MPPIAKYIALALVLLALASLWFVRGRDATDRPPNTPGSITHWMCETCSEQVDLTARQMDDWLRSDDMVRREEGASRKIVFKCEKCETYTLCSAQKCRIHDVWFVIDGSDGKVHDCPKCAAKP